MKAVEVLPWSQREYGTTNLDGCVLLFYFQDCENMLFNT